MDVGFVEQGNTVNCCINQINVFTAEKVSEWENAEIHLFYSAFQYSRKSFIEKIANLLCKNQLYKVIQSYFWQPMSNNVLNMKGCISDLLMTELIYIVRV